MFTLPKEIKQKWLDALRSGQYEQGHGKLKTDDGKYCCLGVLQHCLDGECERGKAPTAEWAKGKGIEDRNDLGFWNPRVSYCRSVAPLWRLNDEDRLSFTAIADIIEAQCEGV